MHLQFKKIYSDKIHIFQPYTDQLVSKKNHIRITYFSLHCVKKKGHLNQG